MTEKDVVIKRCDEIRVTLMGDCIWITQKDSESGDEHVVDIPVAFARILANAISAAAKNARV